MRILLFNSIHGSTFSRLIDWKTTKLGWNPIKHWQYFRNPTGRSHAEFEFGAEAAVWYVDNLNHADYNNLRKLSYDQIDSCDNSFDKSDFFVRGYVLRLLKQEKLHLMFSASEKDKCVRFKLIHKEEGKWTDYKMEGDLELEKKIIRKCADELEGLPYGYSVLPGFLTPLSLVTSSGKKPICSGVVTTIANWWHLQIWPRKGWPEVDPNLLDTYLSAYMSVNVVDEIPLRSLFKPQVERSPLKRIRVPIKD